MCTINYSSKQQAPEQMCTMKLRVCGIQKNNYNIIEFSGNQKSVYNIAHFSGIQKSVYNIAQSTTHASHTSSTHSPNLP